MQAGLSVGKGENLHTIYGSIEAITLTQQLLQKYENDRAHAELWRMLRRMTWMSSMVDRQLSDRQAFELICKLLENFALTNALLHNIKDESSTPTPRTSSKGRTNSTYELLGKSEWEIR